MVNVAEVVLGLLLSKSLQVGQILTVLTALALPAGCQQAPVRVEYVRWQSWEGTGWPAHFECRDDRGKFRLTCRVENAHFPPESAPSRVTLRLPDDVERISREELMSMLERLTSVR